jgi:ribosomal protein L15
MTVAQTPGKALPRGTSSPRQGRAGADQNGNDRRERVFFRLSSEERQRAAYWAQKRGFSSVNEYVAEAVAEQIRRENLDYDLPTLEIARINQLVDEVKALSTNLANLERVVTQGFDSLIGLTRGDNYLLDDEDGELS